MEFNEKLTLVRGKLGLSQREMALLDEETIQDMVHEIRGQKVMLDFDLARIYGYSTKSFNQQIKNNQNRFPKDFRFRVSNEELRLVLRSIFLTAKLLSSMKI